MSDPLYKISSVSLAPPIAGKTPTFSILMGEVPKKEGGFNWTVGVWGEKCITKSFWGNAMGGDSALMGS